MIGSDLEIPFDRITYREGQLLTALDLRDEYARAARLRRLHVRYQHDTWGVVLGFRVAKVENGHAVTVGAGYAHDRYGRELIMSDTFVVPTPTAIPEAMFVLTVRYQDDASFLSAAETMSLCSEGALASSQERPVFAWQRPQDVQMGLDVPLASALVGNGVIQQSVDLDVRRNARRLVRPYISKGTTERGQTGWRLWETSTTELGIEVKVKTAGHGFGGNVSYFAALQGDFSSFIPTQPGFVITSLGFITDATADTFTYRIIGGAFPFGTTVSPSQAEKRGWHVTWMGIQPVKGYEPPMAELYSIAAPSL